MQIFMMRGRNSINPCKKSRLAKICLKNTGQNTPFRNHLAQILRICLWPPETRGRGALQLALKQCTATIIILSCTAWNQSGNNQKVMDKLTVWLKPDVCMHWEFPKKITSMYGNRFSQKSVTWQLPLGWVSDTLGCLWGCVPVTKPLHIFDRLVSIDITILTRQQCYSSTCKEWELATMSTGVSQYCTLHLNKTPRVIKNTRRACLTTHTCLGRRLGWKCFYFRDISKSSY